MCHVEQVQLNLGVKLTLVAKHQAIMILTFDIPEIMEVMSVGRSHIITVNNSAYSADSMELIFTKAVGEFATLFVLATG